MVYDLIIIGAGAAGLFAASKAENINILLLEKKDRPGLKVMVSGGGQCNLTHSGYMSHFLAMYGDQKKFVKPALLSFDNKQTVAYFESLGIECFEREDGKIFPVSLDAKAVVKALKEDIDCKGHKKMLQKTPVLDLYKSEGTFKIVTEGQLYEALNVMIATGGRSYPALGTEGDGYAFARKLGHTVVEPRPGLTGVVSGKISALEWSGIALKEVELVHNMLKARDGMYTQRAVYKGDLLFTHFGISGPVVLNKSRYLEKDDLLYLNLIGMSSDAAEKLFLETAGDRPLAFWLNQIKLLDRFKSELLKALGLTGQEKMGTLSKPNRKALIKWLTQFEVKVDALQGFKQAMVTVGGVDTTEIDSKTMASKIVEGLYFVGEVLNVDGDTGGYNLQWAFSSAVAAVQAIEKRCL
ncbi:aminoacetone oxidase family FAD-binding enzyme [Fusibacter sp. 3D3]|uniref:NAD(P)/FAD-dependent oxidoreductase n=1 Tax=Fusibacter sp. 3D3 TaxID=1048380 RepID=UPI0008532C5F|nr:aminoacetone oxidase family FAD-binding enzyme [Fusibacter sp. 3D3]GAU75477.1 NAD(FAD)-utilizing dehydrogenases [Fusibacter sp. 3D3]